MTRSYSCDDRGERLFRPNSTYKGLSGNQKPNRWSVGLGMVNKGKRCKRPYYNFIGWVSFIWIAKYEKTQLRLLLGVCGITHGLLPNIFTSSWHFYPLIQFQLIRKSDLIKKLFWFFTHLSKDRISYWQTDFDLPSEKEVLFPGITILLFHYQKKSIKLF